MLFLVLIIKLKQTQRINQKITQNKFTVIPVIRIDGAIMQKASFQVQKQLDRISFRNVKELGVVVSSPGGLPVQSDLICQKLVDYTKKKHIPLYTFAEDYAASGGYFILAIGNKIYVDPTSLVGSIGVIGQWSGYKKLLENQGVQVNVHSSNKQKKLQNISELIEHLSEQNKENQNKFKELLEITHNKFIQHIENHRSYQIKIPQDQRKSIIYHAYVFNGEKAMELGLADEIGDYQSVLKQLHPDASLLDVHTESKWQKLKSYIRILRGKRVL
ncbi:hypothetical protein pb186bvf_000844 [Paramecium bursaria]